MAFAQRLLGRRVSHVGYIVEDIPTAVDRWGIVGVGPFFVIENAVFDSVESYGKPGIFKHSGAFSWWGEFGLELHQIEDVQPADAAAKLGVGGGQAVNHVAIETPTAEEDSARLEELGMPMFLLAKVGPIEDRLHWAPFLGHAIEIHQQSEFLTDFWRKIAAAAKDWDGSEPLRPLAL